MRRAALALALVLGGCCSSEVATSARMFERDLRVYVGASKPAPGVPADKHAAAGRALVEHAAELRKLAEGEAE